MGTSGADSSRELEVFRFAEDTGFSSGLLLRVMDGPGEGSVIPLIKREISFGSGDPRESSAGRISLADPSLCRIQVLLRWDDRCGCYELVHDPGAKNPTRVNDRPARRCTLGIGDILSLGASRMRLEEVPSASRRPRPSIEVDAPASPAPVADRRSAAPPTRPRRIPGLDRVSRGMESVRARVGRMQLRFARPVPLQRQIELYTRMEALLRASVPIHRALAILGEEEESFVLKCALSDMERTVTSGLPLSRALERSPRLASGFCVALVRSGEATGRVDDSLHELTRVLQREDDLSRQVARATTYPGFVIAAAALMTFALLKWVMPGLLASLPSAKVPLLTRICMGLVLVVNRPLLLTVAIALLAGAGWLILSWLRTDAGRSQLELLLGRLPLTGKLVSQLAQVRTARSLAAQLRAGVPLDRSLLVAAEACGSVVWRKRLRKMVDSLRAGVPLAKALELTQPEHARTLISMLDAGEESGAVDTLLEHCANLLQADVDCMLDTAVQLIEPILVSGVGLVTALLLLAAVMPIYAMLPSV